VIIDNDQDFVDACSNLLESAGYAVDSETQESGAEEKIRSSGADLVLLDIVMQTENAGFEIVGRMQNCDQLRRIPVIFLTGFFKESSVQQQHAQMLKKWPNVVHILDKPVKPAVLLETVRKAVSGRRAQ